MKVLIFAGAGCSVELGVPAMRKMALDLFAHMETAAARDDQLLAKLRERFEQVDADLETVIEDIDTICDADAVLPLYGSAVNRTLVESAHLTRAEIEWFVQHTCERVRADHAAALWGPLIQTALENDLTVATTNFDRAVELACQRLGVNIDDGFDDFGEKEWAPWSGYADVSPKLLKLHGSTDWYQVRDTAEVVKLRHPMPLFGGVTLQLETAGLGALGSALVLPSREKRKNIPPFPQISHELFSVARAAEVAILVGSSLRDLDLRSVVAECAQRVPTIVVGPELRFGDGLVPANVALVQDLASGSLISTIPQMLDTGSFPSPRSVTGAIGGNTPNSILEDVVTIGDGARSDDEKCNSIEALWRQSVSLRESDIRPLLEAAAGQVARDALALVPLSHDPNELMVLCKELATSSTDSGFQEDVRLLARMAETAETTGSDKT